jgi:hypothetical protein
MVRYGMVQARGEVKADSPMPQFRISMGGLNITTTADVEL